VQDGSPKEMWACPEEWRIELKPSTVIDIIQSKSYAHRAFICAALSSSQCKVIYDSRSEDVEATRECLCALDTNGRIMNCGESGSTLRFLLPVACAMGRSVSFVTKGRLADRPLSPLREELEAHGCLISPEGQSPITISGQLTAGTFKLAGNVSSQFISGLLFALPLLEEDSEIVIEGPLESSAYVDITVDVLNHFGITIEAEKTSAGIIYHVAGGQKYKGPSEYAVEGDWSAAAFWLVWGAIGRKAIGVRGLKQDSKQGDRKIADVIRQFGGNVEIEDDMIISSPSRLRGINVDVSEIPDLAPAIALLGVAAEGTTKLTNAGRLRLKESDRIASITRALREVGANVSGHPDSIVINGSCGEQLEGGTIDTSKDHRIVMMAAAASEICKGEVTIIDSKACGKSYPDYFEIMKKAGLGENTVQK